MTHLQILKESQDRAETILALLQEMRLNKTVSLPENISVIDQSIYKAANFFKQALRITGFWSDFDEVVGGGRDWISAYVGYALQSSGAIDLQNLQQIAPLLLADQYPSGAWGYCPGIQADADSTSWVTLFLQASQTKWDAQKTINILLSHQDQNTGGIATYLGPQYGIAEYVGKNPQDDFSGWCSGHVCVTAAAAQALSACGLNRNHPSVEKLVDFIHATQQIDGYWNSYWFHSKMYATAQCVQALMQLGETSESPVLQRAAQWISATQLADGSWTNGVEDAPGRVFDTALAVWGGVNLGASASFDKAIDWLLKTQRPDGSWDSLPILQFPLVDEHTPWNIKNWAEFTGRLFGVCIADRNRFFTTATVLQALGIWRKRQQEKLQKEH